MNETTSKQLTLYEFFNLLKRYKVWLIGVIAVCLLAAFIFTKFLATPTYQADAQILVNQSKENNNVNNVQSQLDLVGTYTRIITSSRILNEVQKSFPQYTKKEIKEMIQVANDENTQVINITVKNTSSKKALQITNRLSQLTTKEIPKIMKNNNVSILSVAELANDGKPVSPILLVNIMVSLLVGIIIDLILLIIFFFIDNKIYKESDITDLLQINVMGTIPIMNEEGKA